MGKLGDRLFAMAGALSSMVTAFVLATPLVLCLALLVGCFICQGGRGILATPPRTPTAVATATRHITLTPAHILRPSETLIIGATYDVPWGSMLCEHPGDATLDWLDTEYCEPGTQWLDVLDQGVVLVGPEGDWCAVIGECMSLDGTMEHVAGWVACRFLTTTPQD